MRILVVAPGPQFSVTDVQRGWENGFRTLGHDVVTYNLDERWRFFSEAKIGKHKLTIQEALQLATEPLGNVCYRFWPDLIFVLCGVFAGRDIWEVWKDRPHKTALLFTESPYEDDQQAARAACFEPDIVLVNDPSNIAQYAGLAKHVEYMPHAYDPALHSPGPPVEKFTCDFGFCGTAWPSRVEFLNAVNWDGIDFKLAGDWRRAKDTPIESHLVHPITEWFENYETADLYRSSRVSANIYRKEWDDQPGEAWAMGPREVELAATRTFFMREPRAEGDELFPFLPTFTEPVEFEEKLRWHLARPSLCDELAGRAHVAAEARTFENNARRLLALVD